MSLLKKIDQLTQSPSENGVVGICEEIVRGYEADFKTRLRRLCSMTGQRESMEYVHRVEHRTKALDQRCTQLKISKQSIQIEADALRDSYRTIIVQFLKSTELTHRTTRFAQALSKMHHQCIARVRAILANATETPFPKDLTDEEGIVDWLMAKNEEDPPPPARPLSDEEELQ